MPINPPTAPLEQNADPPQAHLGATVAVLLTAECGALRPLVATRDPSFILVDRATHAYGLFQKAFSLVAKQPGHLLQFDAMRTLGHKLYAVLLRS